jgi:hypothetical protein
MHNWFYKPFHHDRKVFYERLWRLSSSANLDPNEGLGEVHELPKEVY